LVHGGGARGQLSPLAGGSLVIAAYVATRRRGHRARLAARLLGLTAAGALALALAAVQVLPVLEHITASVRLAGSGPELLYDSSLLPYRVIEGIWPGVFGTFTAGNRYWMPILPPIGSQRPWPLSLYAGALTLLLAVGAAGFRQGPPWRPWMTAVAILSFWASLGEFGGRAAWRPGGSAPIAGDDSFYGLLTTILPGFRLFRLPFKLLVFTALGGSALAGLGWDRFAAGVGRRRTIAIGVVLSALTLIGLAAVVALRGPLAAAIAVGDPGHAVFGPLDGSGAGDEIVRGMAHGAVALIGGLAILGWTSHHRGAVGALLASVALTFDLAVADARWIITAPQADFERQPEVLGAIREAERRDPGSGPFRIQRLASWVPVGWSETPSPRRLRELLGWEIDSLQPYFGWLHGLEYVFVDESETAPADLRRAFEPVYRSLAPGLSAALGLEPGRRVLYHARGLYDLWGARYFIIPSFPGGWDQPNRSYAAFIEQTDLVYPAPGSFEGPGAVRDRRQWLMSKDFQVRRNRRAFPRAWIVHDVRIVPPLDGARTAARDALLARLRRAESANSADATPRGADLKTTAYIEADDASALFAPPNGQAPAVADPSDVVGDSAVVREESPDQVVIEVTLQAPGVVVLADLFDPGWRLVIDGHPAPILRANLAMRAAAVSAGKHTMIYKYEPRSLDVGTRVSQGALVILAGAIAWARTRPPGRSVPSAAEGTGMS
jgi:hypothetical protein